jgi:serine/threonine protein kinase
VNTSTQCSTTNVQYTYKRLAEEHKIALSEDGQFSCFNTGLVTAHPVVPWPISAIPPTKNRLSRRTAEFLMVTPQGQVKIMDFGLAQLAERSKLTETSTILGTPSYMSPEQAVGEKTDRRTDLWALGVVLYEMVRGQRPFQGQYDQALLYEIVHQEPEPLTGVRAGVPMELKFIVGKCLAKNREDRPASAQEIVRDLRTLAEKLKSGRSTILSTGLHSKLGSGRSAILAADSRMHLPARGASQDASPWGQRLPWALVASLTVTLLALAWLWPTSDTVPAPVRRFSFTFPDVVHASISPNGRHIAYESSGQLWIWDLDQDEPRMLHDQGERPFWSPDSRLVGFHAEGQLWKIPGHGGSVDLLCEAGRFFSGAAWSPDDRTRRL